MFLYLNSPSCWWFTCIFYFTRLLLQGLATNRFLFGLELDLSSCEVSIHSHSHTRAQSCDL